jgi:O-antigen/teichoic acid export membrane protein
VNQSGGIFSSIRWLFGTLVLRKGLVFALFILLARYVSRSTFGLFGEYTQLLAFITLLCPIGLDFLHIVERREEDHHFRALLGVSILHGLIATALLIAFAPVVAHAFHAPQLSAIIRATGVILLVHLVRRAYKNSLQRQMRFRVQALYETANVFFYVLISIFWLYADCSAWIVFVPFFLGDLLETALLIRGQGLVSALRDAFAHLRESYRLVRERRGFLIPTTLANTLNFFAGSAPVFILGLYLKPDQIGLYYVAYQITMVPPAMLNESMSRVFFPAFAAADEDERRRQVERFVFFTVAVGWAFLAVYVFLCLRLTPVFLGTKWIEANALVPALALFAAGSLLANPLSSIPVVVKKPQVEMVWTAISVITRCIVLGIGGYLCLHGRVSLAGVIWAYSLLVLGLYFALFSIACTLLRMSARRLLRRLYIPVILLSCLSIALYLVGDRWGAWGSLSVIVLLPAFLLLLNRLTGGVPLVEMRSLLTARKKEV